QASLDLLPRLLRGRLPGREHRCAPSGFRQALNAFSRAAVSGLSSRRPALLTPGSSLHSMKEGSSGENLTVRDWARTIRDVEGTGDYFQAFELARKAIAAFPDDEQLKYMAVRSLARSGAAER